MDYAEKFVSLKLLFNGNLFLTFLFYSASAQENVLFFPSSKHELMYFPLLAGCKEQDWTSA